MIKGDKVLNAHKKKSLEFKVNQNRDLAGIDQTMVYLRGCSYCRHSLSGSSLQHRIPNLNWLTMPRIVVLVSSLVLICATKLPAQTYHALPRVLELPASTRAMALGGAYMTNSPQADALFYNPALLIGVQGFGLDIQQWGPASWTATAVAARQWFGGGIGIGLQTLQYEAPGTGGDAAPSGQDHLFETGSVPVSERVATIGYAREIKGINLGLAIKLIEERVALRTFISNAQTRDGVVWFDAGISKDLGRFTTSLSYQNNGERLFAGEYRGDYHVADRLTFGISASGMQLGIFDYGITAAVTQVRKFNEGSATIPAAGIEIGYWPIRGRTFVARAGVQRTPYYQDASPFTFGLAYWGDNLVLEWSFQGMEQSELRTHRFGVSWR